MSIIALDLGTTAGFACGTPGNVVHGTAVFKNSRYEGGGMRYLRFRKWVGEMIETLGGPEKITALYFEEVRRHAGTDAAHVYGGLLGHLTALCEEQKIPYAGIPVATIKKYATGKGNAKKDAVIAAVQSWGYSEVTDDNQADAIALFHHVATERHPDLTITLEEMLA